MRLIQEICNSMNCPTSFRGRGKIIFLPSEKRATGMYREREKSNFWESENKWLKPLQLQTCMVKVREISAKDELIVEENIQGLQNQLGTLLLPHRLSSDMRERIERAKYNPVAILFDSEGRVHQLVLDEKYFLTIMDVWKNVYVLRDPFFAEIVQFDRGTQTLVTFPHNSTRFTIPRACLNKLENWVPSGTYAIEHDDEGRVFRISQQETNIMLPIGSYWDTRFFVDPLSQIRDPNKPQLRRTPKIMRRLPERDEEESGEELVQEIEIENDYPDFGMII